MKEEAMNHCTRLQKANSADDECRAKYVTPQYGTLGSVWDIL